MDIQKNLEKINSLKNELDRIRREKADLIHKLTYLREVETKCYKLQFGSYKGTLSQITKRLGDEANEFDWFSPGQEISHNNPFANSDLLNLLKLFRKFRRLDKCDKIKISKYLETLNNLNLVSLQVNSFQ